MNNTTIADNIADSFGLPIQTRGSLITQETIINEFARLTQYITWPLLAILFHVFYDLRIKGRENFRSLNEVFMIVANHVDFYHSFAFRLVLGLLTPHLPLRFMAVTKFEWRSLNFLHTIGIIDFIYSLFGVFTVVPGLGINNNLKKAKNIIKARGNVVIYPEGKINTTGQIGSFKKGAAVLFQQTGVKIVPVSFRLGRRNFWWRELSINVGQPLKLSVNESADKITERIREAVVGLCGGN